MKPAERLSRLYELPLAWPRLSIALLLAVTLLAASGFRAVRFEPDVSQLLPQDDPSVEVQALLDERSRPARSLWLLLRGFDLEREVPRLAERLAASPLVEQVVIRREQMFAGAVARARAAPLWFLADRELDELAAALAPPGRAAAIETLRLDLADDPLAARELALRDPLGLRWLLDRGSVAHELGLRTDTELAILRDGGGALLSLRGVRDAYDADYATALLAHVESVLQGYTFDAYGGYAVARADQARVRGDFELASTVSLLAIAIYLCWVMRGVRLPLLVQLPAMVSIVWAIPFGSLLLGPLPTVAVAAVAVLGGLGVDFAIHYAARYRRARLELPHHEAVRQTQRTTVPELAIDMATTAATFLAVGAGTRGGLGAFGVLLAIGLAGSALLTVVLLPILLRFAGDRRDPERSLLATWADRWLVRRAAQRAAWLVLLLAAIGGGFVLRHGLPLSAAAETMRPPDDPVAAVRQRLEHELGVATSPVAVLWPADAEPTPLWQALEVVRNRGEVRFWSGLDRADTEHGREAVAAFRARTAGALAATQVELAAAGFQAEAFRPALDELARQLAADPEPTPAVTVRAHGREFRAVTLWPVRTLDRAAFARLEHELRAAGAPAASLHGTPTLTAALEAVLRRDLQVACVLALCLAAVMVTLWQRSLRHGLLALVPSSIGVVAVAAGLWLTDVPLSMVSFVAVPFVLGIGVDEGVHLVGHFRHGGRDTGATGVGIVRTSLGTALGFGALLLAETPGLRLLGTVVVAGSLVSMLACLFVLAPLLSRPASRA